MRVKKNVLIVEDNLINRELLAEILSDNYVVFQKENGQEALDFLRSTNQHISLILLDLMMPVMDGYALLDILKNDPSLAFIPVIITTQNNTIEDEIEALDHGAVDFISKPYNPTIIFKRVDNIIKLRESVSLSEQLKYDQLTNVLSKDAFIGLAKEELYGKNNGEYTLLAINIENFKLYNDVYGQKEGDELLIEVANDIIKNIGDHGIIGRYHADRFLCLMANDYFYNLINMKGIVENYKNNVIIRVGVYSVIDLTVPVESMCDRAMLVADSIHGEYGRFYAYYDDHLRSKLIKNKIITDTMENAIINREFQVYLQPKYRISDGMIVGAEALVRWMHPQLGFLSPGEFIPLFEKNGFIFKLNNYMWEETCKILQRWKDEGLNIIPISVNVSRSDCYRCDLSELFSSLIEKYKLSSDYIHIEITESAYVDNINQIKKSLDKLRDNGFKIEMDDFGSEYSSLGTLSEINIDILKLDMKLVQSETKYHKNIILKYIIDIAHKMNLEVVAEGVEEKYQVDALKEYGCDFAQGYYYSKPMSARDFRVLLCK